MSATYDHSPVILQVNTGDQGGGAEGSSLNLHRSYLKKGIHSYLAVGRKHLDDDNILAIPNRSNRSFWAKLWLRHLDHFDQSGCGRIRRLIAEPFRTLCRLCGLEDMSFPGTELLLNLPPERPDILHCHNLHGGYFDLRQLPALSRQVPVILNLRDSWLYTGHCAYPISCKRWKFGCGNCPDLQIYPKVHRDATSFNFRRKSQLLQQSHFYLTTVSQWLMDESSHLSWSPRMSKVIYNGIDTSLFSPGKKEAARKKLGIPPDKAVILTTAHSPFKGYPRLVEVASQTEFQEKTLLFICLGRSDEDIVLKNGRILHRPFIKSVSELSDYYRAADIYLHLPDAEAFGKTIVEAMACSTPIVASNVGGMPEIVDHKTTGYLIEHGDIAAAAQAISSILGNKVLGEKLAEAALNKVAKKFTLLSQVNNFLTWYDEVIDDWKHCFHP